MPDPESRRLDTDLLAFIRKYRRAPAPELAFELLALRVFRYQFARNVHYRKFCEFEKRSPGEVQNWKEIPAMPALAFKELVLASFPMKDRVRVFRTSGTTRGTSATKTSADAPLRGAHFFDTLALYESAILPLFERYFDGDKASYYFLIAPAKEAPDSSLSYMMDVVDRRLARGRGKYYVKKGEPLFVPLAGDLAKERKRTVLLSTAFALKGFLDHLAMNKTRLRLPRGSRLMETGGFKGRAREISKKALVAACQKYLGIPAARCVSEYGMTELSSQCYAPAGGIFTGPAWLKTLVIDPRTGQEAKKGRAGLLRHVDLANRGSVMAVQTEDLGRATGEGFELLGRAAGSELRGCSLRYEEFIRRGE